MLTALPGAPAPRTRPLRPVTATYRLQLQPAFGFADAGKLVGYLAQLGVSHLYLSPILEAVAGSQHGYDVVDPTRVREELGGIEGFRALAEEAHQNGLGIVLDIVPHHMAASHENPWWWDVLRRGEASRWSNHFDIDWHPPESRLEGKVVLPILGDHYGRVLDAGEIQLERRADDIVVRYHEHFAPLTDETVSQLAGVELTTLNADPDRLDAILEQQHHRLVRWQAAAYELDYRRFFAIDSLVALRTEHEAVFVDTHALVLDLVRDGLVDGLRIDHVDGLRDPAVYVERLRAAAPSAWIIVEKINGLEEELPSAWPIDGTSGYEHIAQVTSLLTDANGLDRLVAAYRSFTGEEREPEDIVLASRREELADALHADLDRIVVRLRSMCDGDRHWRDYSRIELRDALAEVLVHAEGYRAYVRPGRPPTDADVSFVRDAVARAAEARPDIDGALFDLLASVLLGAVDGDDADAVLARFQQLSGPVAAKGEEDTASYRWVPYLPLNEVGSDLTSSPVDLTTFHRLQQRTLATTPRSMRAGSTHDTKRSEDVRARLAVLSEQPDLLIALAARWAASAGDVDRPTQWFVHQTLIGAHPIGLERASAVLRKSLREAKVATSWTQPNDDYEHAVLSWVEVLLDDAAYQRELALVMEAIDRPGRTKSLTEVVLRTLCPGRPDIYQGCELWDHSLVDPDNRRPVDFTERAGTLDRVADRDLAELWESDDRRGLVKLALLHRCLELRARFATELDEPDSYLPLGPGTDLVAFLRGTSIAVAAPRSASGAPPDSATVSLPPGRWRSVLTEVTCEGGDQPFGALRGGFPVAVLTRQ